MGGVAGTCSGTVLCRSVPLTETFRGLLRTSDYYHPLDTGRPDTTVDLMVLSPDPQWF